MEEQTPIKSGEGFNIIRWYEKNPKAILFIIILIGLSLRWYQLDTSRPIHHDESLHGMYGQYAYDRPSTSFYKYQPLLHGPILYNVMPWVYDFLGNTDFAVRFPMALMGSLFLFLPFLFRRFLTTKALLFLTAYIAIAPSIVYWSRFSRHDYFMISAHFLLLYGLLIAPAKRRGVYALTSLALQLAIKENSYVFMALCLGYLIFEFF